MPSVNIHIAHRRPIVGTQWTQKEGLRHLANFLQGVMANGRDADSVHWSFQDSVAPNTNDTTPGPAAGLLTLSGGAGAVGATLGGTLVTAAYATSDANTAGLVAAAIRANATVNRFLTASNKIATATLTSVAPGTTVNVFGLTFTAIANGASPVQEGQFSVGANDTAAALNLATAINRMPGLAYRCRAVSITNAVHIGMWDDRTPLPYERINQPSASSIALTQGVPTASARVMVFANTPGQIGNFVTAVASGTGMTYATNGNAGQLGSGTGGAPPSQTNDVQP